MYAIRPSIQRYAWGGTRFIPELLGMDQFEGPYAELWYGAHPSAPSTLMDGTPLHTLESARDLPYLLKILSIQTPLSIQVHPTRAQAQEGFNSENRAGIALNDPSRNFKDPNHKPETIVALEGGLEARAGLRDAEEIDRILQSLGSASLNEIWLSDDVRENVGSLMSLLHSLDQTSLEWLLRDVVQKSDEGSFSSQYAQDAGWLKKCSEIYPGDPGIIIQLLMNYVSLSPGEALHMNAGQLHAYLYGNGVEIMAVSDNVVRAGLTPKHIDLTVLRSIADFEPSYPAIDSSDTRAYIQRGISDYRLEYVPSGPRRELVIKAGSIALCMSGGVLQNGNTVRPGLAGFFEEDQEVLTTGSLFIASAG